MKLTFSYEGLDDAHDMHCMLRAGEMWNAIVEVRAYIRNTLKHGDRSAEVQQELVHLREVLRFHDPLDG